ncbi:ABC transporter ATP-binding protein [Lentzea cavernae]|uniref:HlyB/MsbA family ABC transporter n=1 Tax=Lentzea cavernae TaxID=2020703 RepID=A0ABQ3MT28_9PSEU|nr:ABC transporter ATP-binding protein [Lentzea cavernae]GHH61310.1 HlyB/MsbA family ABC transporter [Lentzea cavernae]
MGRRELLESFGFAFRLAWRANRSRLTQVLVIQFVMALGASGALVAGKHLLTATMPPTGSSASLVPAIAALILLGTVGGVLRAAGEARQRVLVVEVDRYVIARVLASAAQAELVAFEDAEFHDRLHRAVFASRNQPVAVVTMMMTTIQTVLTVGAVAGAFAVMAWWLLPFALLSALPALRAAAGERESGYRMHHDLAEDRRHRSYLERLLTGRDEAKEVRALGLGPVLRDRWESGYDREIRQTATLCHKYMWRKVVARCTGDLVLLGVVAVAWFGLRGDPADLPALLTALPALWLLSIRMQTVGAMVGGVSESLMYLRDLRTFVDCLVDEHDSPRSPRFSTLSARGITFVYPGAGTPALDGIDITLKEGEIVALVGANGSGKTTLAKVLAGLYEPDAGVLQVDGSPVRDRGALRDQTAVVFQDYVRYKLSAEDNIAFGRAGAPIDHQRVVSAAEQADARVFVERLSDGFGTVLSKEFTGGADLSLGQWQRLALARAFYRDSPFVVLDEPTASLDPQAEADLFARIRVLFAGRTVLLISHRFATVRDADRIYVLDKGKIVEHGSHDTLMADGGEYSRLYELQARAFREPSTR